MLYLTTDWSKPKKSLTFAGNFRLLVQACKHAVSDVALSSLAKSGNGATL